MVKPFYIKYTSDMSRQDVADIFSISVSRGATLVEKVCGVQGDDIKAMYPHSFKYFGVDEKLKTRFEDSACMFGRSAEKITIAEFMDRMNVEVKEDDSKEESDDNDKKA